MVSWAARALDRAEVAERLLLAPAELLLDALPPLSPQSRFLEVGAGRGAVAHPLVDRIAGLGHFVAVDADPALATALPVHPGHAVRLVAAPDRLPFQSATFDVAIGNLVVGDASDDAARLSELRRVLRPGGLLLTTLCLRGSFDELFDVFTEAAEAAALSWAREALQDARDGLLDDDGARALLAGHGFSVLHTGIEERALFFPDVQSAFGDPLLRDVLVPGWLRGEALPRAVWDHAAGAATAYFGSGRLAVRVRTAILTGRVAAERRSDAPRL